MIRSNVIAGAILFLVLAMNGLTLLRVNQKYTEYLNQTLLSQSQLCGERMEETLQEFSGDLNQELNMYSSEIFSNPVKFREATRSLRLFYTKYRDLITKISILDNHRNYYALYLDSDLDPEKGDGFVVDSFETRRQNLLSPVEKMEQIGSVLEFHYPYLGQDVVAGNVVVELDLKRYAESIFRLYPQGSGDSWQWILDMDGQVIINRKKLASTSKVRLLISLAALL